MAEAEARKRGCSNATLNTFSFQAPEFYRKLGYRIVATIEGGVSVYGTPCCANAHDRKWHTA